MNTTTTTTQEGLIQAYLDAPNLGRYEKYSDYLHDFNLFLDFLSRHPNVASSQTGKRVKQPSVAAVESLQARVRSSMKAKEDSDSDWSGPGLPTPSVSTVAIRGGAPKPAETTRPVVPVIAAPNPAASNPSATLLGKKKCAKQLRLFCTHELADRLVSTDWISRDPLVFPRMLEHLGRVSAHHSRQLGLDDVKIRVLDHAPDALPGLVSYPDYKAIFEASDPGSD
jgi:hypothetical protein